jgi:glycosyltransferase involved in cell wall biosynthesis
MIYLAGITSNQKENIDLLTGNSHKHFDGLIFVDDFSTDGTFELLKERCGLGEIVQHRWTNNHDWQMNEIFSARVLSDGDWFFLRDSMERFDGEWVKGVRALTEEWDKQGIQSVFNYGKGFAFKYNDCMTFQGSPHWGLQGCRMQSVDLKDFYSEEKKEHTWRVKDGEEGGRPFNNCIDHEAKYYFVYGRSNHLLLGLEDKWNIYNQLEQERQYFRDILSSIGVPLTIDGLKDFFADSSNWFSKMKNTQEKANIQSVISRSRILLNFVKWHFGGEKTQERFDEIKRTELRYIQEE